MGEENKKVEEVERLKNSGIISIPEIPSDSQPFITNHSPLNLLAADMEVPHHRHRDKVNLK
jgi:hypothetical protein